MKDLCQEQVWNEYGVGAFLRPLKCYLSLLSGNPRNKTALKPGFSLMDWIRLTKSGKDLSGTGGQILQVTPRELSLHKKKKDAMRGFKFGNLVTIEYDGDTT